MLFVIALPDPEDALEDPNVQGPPEVSLLVKYKRAETGASLDPPLIVPIVNAELSWTVTAEEFSFIRLYQ
jgi:hypothetical protein